MSLVVSNPAARTQPGRSPDSTTRQPGNPATRQPGNPAAPGSTWKWMHVLTAWQHPAAPGSTRQHPGTRQPGTDPATPRQPGNPTRQHPATRQPGLNLAHVTFTGTGGKNSRLVPLWDQTRVWDPGD